MKLNQWVVGLLGVVLGVSGTIGTQWVIANLPTTSGGSASNNDAYQGFEDDYVLDSVSWDDYFANQYPEEDSTPIVEGIYDFNWYEYDRLEDQTYFLAHAEVETILGIEVRYTTFVHLTEDLSVIWEYAFIPSDEYIQRFAVGNYAEVSFDVHKLKLMGNTVIIGFYAQNFNIYFDEVTQTDRSEFIGDKFLPIGADETAENQYYSASVSINLDTYAFDILAIEALSPALNLVWEDFVVLGDDLLVHAMVRSTDPDAEVSVFNTVLDGAFQYFSFFFRYTLNDNQIVEIEHLGYILTNLDFNLGWRDLLDFNGYLYEHLDNRIHLFFDFEYSASSESNEFGEPLLVDFSEEFDLITGEGRSEIEDYFQNFDLLNTTKSINFVYHALIDIMTLDVFHDEIVKWSYEITQNNVSINLRMFFASEDDFAILITEEVFNYSGEGEYSYQLIAASTRLKQYNDGSLDFEMTFSDDQVVLFTDMIRTLNHYIFVGRTNNLHSENTPASDHYKPSAMILLTSRDFVPIDTLIIDTDAPTYIEGILLNESTLSVVFWSVTDKEEFSEILGQDEIYKAIITLILE